MPVLGFLRISYITFDTVMWVTKLLAVLFSKLATSHYLAMIRHCSVCCFIRLCCIAMPWLFAGPALLQDAAQMAPYVLHNFWPEHVGHYIGNGLPFGMQASVRERHPALPDNTPPPPQHVTLSQWCHVRPENKQPVWLLRAHPHEFQTIHTQRK